ncbi:hypothetical protein HOC01_00615 [archaeon]|jgi:hypothetical protein|nr:hypothetical protein [archaeon]MBT6698657.1 hypothetical protein [archaeon]
MDPIVIDISNTRVNDDDLIATDYDPSLYRYSKDQVLTIAKRLYIPHQVTAWNATGRFQDDGSVEEPVVLKKILPRSLAVLAKMYETLASMPPGTYYQSRLGNLDDNRGVDYRVTQSESLWIGRKQFAGYVTNKIDYRYFFHTDEGNAKIAGKSLYVSLGIEETGGQVQPSHNSGIWSNVQALSEEALSDLLSERFDLWREQNVEFFESRCQWEVDWREESARKEGSNETWELEYFLKIRNIPKSLPVLFNKKVGDLPTKSVQSAEELFGFVKRYLTNVEVGKLRR